MKKQKNDIRMLLIADTLDDAKEIKGLFRRTGFTMRALMEFRIACEDVDDDLSELDTIKALGPYIEKLTLSLMENYRSPAEMDRDILAILGFIDKTGIRKQG